MTPQTIIGAPLSNLPWEARPTGCTEVMWRYSKNPIITRDALPLTNSIFNSAVVPYEGAFIGIFRADNRELKQRLHVGRSKDGFEWELEPDPIQFVKTDPEIDDFHFGYDPRLCWIEDRYYVTWCNYFHGPTIGVAYTYDFKTFHRLENAFVPHNRNGVLFPRKINGKYAMLNRPSDNFHTSFGDIFFCESPDLCYWGRHRFVMATRDGWQRTKVGAGPIPIETSEGWLLFYHGVTTTCNGMVYSIGAALLDLEKPWKVIYRTKPYLMTPWTQYERVGDVPNVIFPVATLCDAVTGHITFYYGGADTVVCMAFAQVDEVMAFLKSNSYPPNSEPTV